MNENKKPTKPDDEVISFLDSIAILLRRLNEGILHFLFRFLPEWLMKFVDLTWFVKLTNKVGLIAFWGTLLVLLVLGPFVLMIWMSAPWYIDLAWGVLVVSGLVYAFNRYLVKEAIRKAELTRAGKLICRHCRTRQSGDTAPANCEHCGKAWA